MATAQDNSVLSSGQWYKLAVSTQGIYKIDYDYLTSLGIDPGSINPNNIQLYGNGGKMLPQSLQDPRPIDLIENAIFVKGANDGQFNTNDYFLFYGQSPDSISYNEITGTFDYVNNFYVDNTYYFLTIGSQPGKRIESTSNLGDTYPKISSYDYYDIIDKDLENILISGREWYGDRFNSTTSYQYPLNIPNIDLDGDIQLTSAVMAQSYDVSSFDVSINGNLIGSQSINGVSTYTYGVRGYDQVDVFAVNTSNVLTSGNDINIQLTYNKNSSGKSIGNLNYLLFHADRNLRIESEGFTFFRSIKSLDNTLSTFEINNTLPSSVVWDVTNPLLPVEQSITHSNGKATFGTTTMALREYVVFNPNEITQQPISQGNVPNQNLSKSGEIELLIISPLEFIAQAKRLAEYRESNEGYVVKVTTPNAIYNEFSGGSQDATAIRDYAKLLYDQGSLEHLLLFGKCSYDYKSANTDNTNYVPTYQSRNSLHPLKTYSSDDYFAFLDDTEGEWEESAAGDHTMDIGVGRLPIKTVEEAQVVVDKLINYSKNTFYDEWKNKIVFVADDGDFNIHQKQANQMITFVDTAYKNFEVERIFLDDYEQLSKPSGEVAPAVNSALDAAINNGALIVNFTGHGGESGWAQERILDHFMIEAWNNSNRLPLFVTATCEFGRHDDPNRVSGGEKTLLNGNGGAIGIVTTARPVNSSTNFELNKAFYDVIFSQSSGNYMTLGDIFKLTKNNSLNGSSNRNFSLLGDPSMQLTYPKDILRISAVNSRSVDEGYDTLKAISQVHMTGEVMSSNNIIRSDFNGIVKVTIYDKQADKQTLGNENSPFSYKQWQNILFKGEATVTNGEFEFEFVVPKNIDYEIGSGRIAMFATNNNGDSDAHGANISIPVGGSSTKSASDTTAPAIELFINDTTFVNGNSTGNNILLLAKLSDSNGINTSLRNGTNNITATLDDDISFILNNYYTAETDTYQSGWVILPVNDLSEGWHTITVSASDTYNNSNSSNISFLVTNSGTLQIDHLNNYPNPVKNLTEFVVNHNRSGDDMELQFHLYSPKGEIIKSFAQTIEDCSSNLSFFEWDGKDDFGNKLRDGIYIYRVSLRSLTDGAKNQRFQKLVLLK